MLPAPLNAHFSFPKRWEQWLKTLIGGAISGGANAALASLGPTIANSVGITVKAFEPTQVIDMFVCGAMVGALMFLAKSPVPPDSTGNTDIIPNPNASPNPQAKP